MNGPRREFALPLFKARERPLLRRAVGDGAGERIPAAGVSGHLVRVRIVADTAVRVRFQRREVADSIDRGVLNSCGELVVPLGVGILRQDVFTAPSTIVNALTWGQAYDAIGCLRVR